MGSGVKSNPRDGLFHLCLWVFRPVIEQEMDLT